VWGFHEAVDIDAAELAAWLAGEQSRSVGQRRGGSTESVGHRSGRRIVRLLGKDEDDLTDGDLAQMRTVTRYVHRHLAQRPDGDVRETPWRWSLMKWGHDPER
jgi:hypothetical protein